MTDPPCEHRVITTWTSDNATVAMWACAECSRRFYPACSVCVSVGHRNIVHQPAAPAEGLDVERLVAAIHNWHNPSAREFGSVCNPDGHCRVEAALIAREYAAIKGASDE